jgi:hypothetical protein
VKISGASFELAANGGTQVRAVAAAFAESNQNSTLSTAESSFVIFGDPLAPIGARLVYEKHAGLKNAAQHGFFGKANHGQLVQQLTHSGHGGISTEKFNLYIVAVGSEQLSRWRTGKN